ncbi:MAG TPA: TetR/AcrR family transcriptional regulator, partial [Pseudonocardiaceae bacterium]
TSTGRRVRSDATANRERLLAVAAEVFAVEGLSTTLADVATKAGIGVGTVYRHFANKDDLIYHVYAPRLRMAQQLTERATRSRDAWEGLAALIEQASWQLAIDKGFRQFILGGYTEVLGDSPSETSMRLLSLLEQTHSQVSAHLDDLIGRAKSAGALRADFESTDIQLLAAAIQATVDLGGTERPDVYRRVVGLLLDGLRQARPGPTPLPARALNSAGLSQFLDAGHRSPSAVTGDSTQSAM